MSSLTQTKITNLPTGFWAVQYIVLTVELVLVVLFAIQIRSEKRLRHKPGLLTVSFHRIGFAGAILLFCQDIDPYGVHGWINVGVSQFFRHYSTCCLLLIGEVVVYLCVDALAAVGELVPRWLPLYFGVTAVLAFVAATAACITDILLDRVWPIGLFYALLGLVELSLVLISTVGLQKVISMLRTLEGDVRVLRFRLHALQGFFLLVGSFGGIWSCIIAASFIHNDARRLFEPFNQNYFSLFGITLLQALYLTVAMWYAWIPISLSSKTPIILNRGSTMILQEDDHEVVLQLGNPDKQTSSSSNDGTTDFNQISFSISNVQPLNTTSAKQEQTSQQVSTSS